MAATTALSRAYWSAFTLWHARRESALPYRPLEEIAALQARRLRAMLTHAFKTVPHYREMMLDLGLTPADFRTAADLEKLPLTKHQDLAERPERFVSTAVPRNSCLELTTTGSSGTFKRVLVDPSALFQARAAGLRQRQVWARFLGRITACREVAIAREGGTRPVIQTFYRDHAWVPRQLDLRRAIVSPGDSFARNVEVINSFKPDLIVGFGAYVGAIFRWAWLNDIAIHSPKLISYGGDHLRPPDRRLINTEYGIPILSTYQTCEALHMAFQCEQRQGFHISIDQVAVRVVNSQGCDLPPGVPGNIVISNLTNRATVLLNYQLGDRVTLAAQPCPCGRTLPLLASLDGRAEDVIVLPNGEVAHETVILPQLYDVPGVLQLQLQQLGLQEFRLLVVTASESDWSPARRNLDATLRTVLGHGEELVVSIERVADIPCGPTGKFTALRSACTQE